MTATYAGRRGDIARLVVVTAVATVLSGLSATTASASLSAPPRGTTIQAIENVNLRSGPSTTHSVILTVPAGHTASVLSATPQGGFYRVAYRGYTGWTHGEYWNAVSGLVVNGHQLTASETASVRWIAQNTMPRITGTRADRLTNASRVTWWSLKEGVLGLSNPHSFSHCDNQRIDPLASCAAQCCWQVGIAATQEPNYSLAATEATAVRLYSGWTVRQVLAHTATYAGYPSGTSGHQRIVDSTGDFRNSWLLRNHGVGFTHQAPTVRDECVNASLSWCYGTGWTTTARYAPNRSAAMRAIGELHGILDALAP